MRPVLDREIVIDRVIKMVNGPGPVEPNDPFAMTRKRAERYLDMSNVSNRTPMMAKSERDPLEVVPDANLIKDASGLIKDVNVSTGLTYYDLRAPALNLFPTVTPLRNAIPRRQLTNPGDAYHWKSVIATVGSGIPYVGWVPERQRAASMSYQTTNNTAAFASLGEEDSLSDEARYAAMGFEDEDALVQLRLMLKFMVKEEAGILGGNNTLSLSTPSAPTLTAPATSGATISAATYSVIVVALTQEGYLNSSVSGGVVQSVTVTGNDGKTFTLKGGSSNKSSNTTQAVSAGQGLAASTPVVNGAVAYAWYAGAAGSETLQAITALNSVILTSLSTGNQAATAITANCSNNNGLAFDGLLTTAYLNAGSNAYVQALATGTAGAGTQMTSSGQGSVNEIDTMLKSMWDNYRVSPTAIYVNSQELRSITALVLNGSSAPLLKYEVQADASGGAEYRLTAAGVISFYFNPYTANGGAKIPVKLHPNLAPGTILAICETLPPWYVSSETPTVAEVVTRRDLYTEDWVRTTRAQYYGVYAQEGLAVYAPFGCGVITNIAPTL